MKRFENKKIASEAGKKGKPGKHTKTKQWEALGDAITTTHADRFNRILNDCDDSAFATLYLQTLNYFKPKMQQTSLDVEGEVRTITGITFIDKHKSV